MTISNNILQLKKNLPSHVTLVAVSKTKPAKLILEAYEGGQKDFGENKVQEMTEKQAQLPNDIRWHLIGHLQSNKVKYIAPFVHLIHSVDSLKLLEEINKQAQKNNRTIPVLLQFHIAQEETKFGLNMEEALSILNSSGFLSLKNIIIKGVMGMASFTENKNQVISEFKSLQQIFTALKNDFFSNSIEFDTISMGMSGDYEIAIQEGSTLIRVGSAIFGGR